MLQEILGHASVTTTLDLYGHLYPGDMDRYADRLGDAAADATGKAKEGQTTPGTWRATMTGQVHDLGKLWRARRDSNPHPSDP